MLYTSVCMWQHLSQFKVVFRSVFSASQGTTSDSMMGEDITEPSQDMSSAWAGMSFLTDPYQ